MTRFGDYRCFSGECDHGDHDPRTVSVIIEDSRNHNQNTATWIRCSECGHIVHAKPDADLLSEYGVEI